MEETAFKKCVNLLERKRAREREREKRRANLQVKERHFKVEDKGDEGAGKSDPFRKQNADFRAFNWYPPFDKTKRLGPWPKYIYPTDFAFC